MRRTETIIAIGILVTVLCYLHLVTISQKSSFDAYRAGYDQGYGHAMSDLSIAD